MSPPSLPPGLEQRLLRTALSLPAPVRRGLGRRVGPLLGWVPAPAPPRQVHLSVTDRCFLPCMHCDIHRNRSPDLPGTTWRAIIDAVARWAGPVDANFVGGEPLMRRDLEELAAHAVGRGFRVSFNTNGWMLTRRRARQLWRAGVSVAYVSLDGTREETVDRTRGRRGAFRRALAAIGHLEAVPSPRVILACVLHGANAAEIPALLRMVRKRGHELVIQPLYQNFGPAPFDPSWYRDSPLWPKDPAPVHRALDHLMEARRQGGPVCNSVAQLQAMKGYFEHPTRPNGYGCRAGFSDLAIDPRGGLRLCFYAPPVATWHEGCSLEAVWTSAPTLRARHAVTRCHRTCNLLNCNFEQHAP